MIAGISKLITLHLAPVFSLVSLILLYIAYFAPVTSLHTEVSLVSLTPAITLVALNARASRPVDGPSVFMGILGSCARFSNSAPTHCTAESITPTYDLSVLPDNHPRFLSNPTTTAPQFLLASLIFLTIFLILHLLFSLPERLPTTPAGIVKLAKHSLAIRLSAWLGILGLTMGLCTVIVLRIWIGKAVDDFNQDIIDMGKGAPQLVANIGNGFTMMWISFSFAAPSIICALFQVQFAAAAGKA
ncbi:transmembrane protein, putative [Rhizoctonia solani AG-3 Rhs1AP]|uniref:Transmembrane protein, putative n=2 Tax=Rhizoctonia solani AG-3 TaxID=1086053 RepID=X8JFN4_9AGAM|nr:transmembrane protein, putative [Rhizoctonia solani AG-3 Rhs1AP]KEP55654.1 putative transmembrane protein [Rhizoctonia solani 123E]